MRSGCPMLALCGLLLGGCDRSAAVDAPLTEADVAEVGAAAAQQLRQTLVQRLTAAIDSGGAASAIGVCVTDAGALTDSIARELGTGVEVKRTSARVRNARNAPDSLELVALAHFTSVADTTGELPDRYVQPAGNGVYRYYEPLRVMPMCVQCHGPADSIAPDVRAVIAERYPEDRAMDYMPGDFRGLIRVSLPASAVRSES